MFDIALGIFLFLSPIFFLPIQIGNVNALQFYQFGILGNNGYNYLQFLFFEFGVLSLFIISLLSKPQREFNNKWMVVLLSLFCLNVYFHPIGIKMIAPILLGFLLYYLVVVYTKDYKKLFKFIFLVSLINTVFAILQFFHINLIYEATGRVDGLMCLSTHLGVYQIIVLPICYALNPFLAIIPMIGIVLSKSVTAIFIMLILVLTRVFVGIKIKNKVFKLTSMPLFLILLSMILYCLYLNWGIILNKIDARMIIWIYLSKEILQKIIGYGIKPFEYLSPVGLFENTCSVYLGIVRWLGILVLIPIFMLIRQVWKNKNSVLALSIFTALLVGIEKSIMDYPRLAGTVIVLFGLLAITKKEAQVENSL